MNPLVLVGTALSVYSNFQANQNQASAELQNARFYELQAQFAKEAMSRESQLAKKKYTAAIGAQKGAYAKAGVSLSEGSSLSTIADSIASQVEELSAIRKKGEMDIQLAKGRAAQARGMASTLSSPLYNLTQAASTALTGYAIGKEG